MFFFLVVMRFRVRRFCRIIFASEFIWFWRVVIEVVIFFKVSERILESCWK